MGIVETKEVSIHIRSCFQGGDPSSNCYLILPKSHRGPDDGGTKPPLTFYLVPRPQLDALLGNSFVTDIWAHLSIATCSTQDKTFQFPLSVTASETNINKGPRMFQKRNSELRA